MKTNNKKKAYIRDQQNSMSFAIDRKQILEPVLTFDLETHEWINFVVMGFYELDSDHYRYFDNMKEALEYMIDYCIKNGFKHIFGHFAGKFDFNFVLDCMYRDFTNYSMPKGIMRGSGFLSMIIKREHIETESDFELTFHDSSALFPMGLARLASMMGVETQKGSVDFKYLLKAWKNETYQKELLEATYQDEFNITKTRHKVFVKGIETTNNKKIIKAESKDITYTCFDDEKTYKIYNKNDILDYLKDDCISLAQSIRKFQMLPFIAKAKKSKTIAGQAIRVLQTYLPEGVERYIPKSKSIEDEFCRRGYVGGRTEVFKHLFSNCYNINNNPYGFPDSTLLELETHKGKTLKCFDVNSLYPTQMLNIFPLRCKGLVKGEANYNKYKWGMWRVKVRVPLDAQFPFLASQLVFESGSSKLCFTVGEFDGYWTKEELEYAKTLNYKIIEYYEGVVYSSADYIFKSFIEDMYAMRLKAQLEGDEATRGIVKLIMNSAYGKIGMRTDDKVFIRDTKYLTDFEQKGSIVVGDREIMFEEVPSDTSNIFHKVIIPAYVTAYARIHMHKIMLPLGEKNVYYTDTDSIYTTEDMATGDKLGELKKESENDEAVFLMPKTYALLDLEKHLKTVMKGYDRRKVKSFTFKELMDYKFLEAAELKAFDPAKFITLGSAFMKGTFLGMVRDTKDELKRFQEQELFLAEKIEDATIKGDLLSVKSYMIKKNRLRENFESKKTVNYKEIKSKYDKRLPCEDQINTTPIILGVINGIYESDFQKQGSSKSRSKCGPDFE